MSEGCNRPKKQLSRYMKIARILVKGDGIARGITRKNYSNSYYVYDIEEYVEGREYVQVIR